MEISGMSTIASAKTKILEAALSLFRAKGYAATSVDDLCRQAGVTKGRSFIIFAARRN